MQPICDAIRGLVFGEIEITDYAVGFRRIDAYTGKVSRATLVISLEMSNVD